MQFFTHYWANATVQNQRRLTAGTIGYDLEHIAGNLFTRRGVMSGDVVYVISYHGDKLFVIGRLTVDRIVDEAGARAYFGTSDLWQASEHVLGRSGKLSQMHFDRTVDKQAMRDVEFIRPDGSMAPPARNRLSTPAEN